MYGKLFRLGRIINPETGKTLMVPMDHSGESGPLPGIEKPSLIVKELIKGGADAIIVHEGFAKSVINEIRGRIGLVLKLTNATPFGPDPTNQLPYTTVENAVRLGADAVSVQVHIGSKAEDQMLKLLGEVSAKCNEWGMPLLSMMYPVKSDKINEPTNVEYVKVAARIGAEIGSDIVKVSYTGDPESFKEVVETCPVPIVVAGGPKVDNPIKVLEMVRAAMDAGAIGVALGRNIWQYKEPKKMVAALRRIIHDNVKVDEAKKEL